MGVQDFGTFLGGLNSQIESDRQYNRQQADIQQKREDAVFTALANSDDPDIRAAAVTGLLTGKSPGKFFDRFMGKMSEHPSFEQIKSLVASGHQAYPGATEGTRLSAQAQTKGQITGRIGGAVEAAKEAGAELTPDQTRQMIMGSAGAAQSSRTLANRFDRVNIHLDDGTETAGFYDKSTGEYYDEDHNYLSGVKYATVTGPSQARTGSTGVGAKWQSMKMKQFRQMFPAKAAGFESIPDNTDVQARVSADGSDASEPVLVSPPPALESYTFQQTDQGIGRGATHGGGYSIVAPGVQGPTAPATAAAGVRELQSAILRMHPAPKGLLGGPATPRDQQRWQQAVDAEAKNYGYPNFKALQDAVAQATTQVQQSVPSAQGPPQVPGAPPNPRQARPPGAGRPNQPANAADPLGILR